MKKILLACAALAVVALPAGSAMAKTHHVSLDGFCDAFTITDNGAGVNSIADDPSTCTTWYGVGINVKEKGVGKISSFGMLAPDVTGTSYYVTFTTPFVTGGTFNMYITGDGIGGDGFLALTDTYTVTDGADHKGRGKASAKTMIERK
jgi:hypothetical protein